MYQFRKTNWALYKNLSESFGEQKFVRQKPKGALQKLRRLGMGKRGVQLGLTL